MVAIRDIPTGEVVLSEVAAACAPILQAKHLRRGRRSRCASCRTDVCVGGIRTETQVVPACTHCADWIVKSGFVRYLQREVQFVKDAEDQLPAELVSQCCLVARLLWHSVEAPMDDKPVDPEASSRPGGDVAVVAGQIESYAPSLHDIALMQTFGSKNLPAGITHSDLTRKFRDSQGGRVGGIEADAAVVSRSLEQISTRRLAIVRRAAMILLVGAPATSPEPASAESSASANAVGRRTPLVNREWIQQLREAGASDTSEADDATITNLPEVVVPPSSVINSAAQSRDATLAEDADLLSRLMLAFDVNNFAATGIDLSAHSVVVCPLLAALNHDCEPNCAVEWTTLLPPTADSKVDGDAVREGEGEGEGGKN